MERKRYILVFFPGHENREQLNIPPIDMGSRQDFNLYYRYLRWFRIIFIFFNVFILYALFQWIGIQTIGVLVASVIIIKELVHLSFLRGVEHRVFAPILKLKEGVEEIAKGNYNVRVESNIQNEIGSLIDSFNAMAEKLQYGEQIKAEYEENRKTLIANISHDLKTPITSIQGYIEGITDGVITDPEKVDKYLKIIYRNTVYMNKLIDDLFLFSKLDMEKLDFYYEQVQIRAYMRDVMEEFHLELEERQIAFHFTDAMDCDPLVYIDRKRIYQAIRNVVGNAVKFGAGRDLQVTTRLSREKNFARIDIQDNGPGIPTDKLSHIFERFYRVDMERTKDFMSTGLGLAITKELVEAHGGKIGATSTEGEGSCFSIYLPFAEGRDF